MAGENTLVTLEDEGKILRVKSGGRFILEAGSSFEHQQHGLTAVGVTPVESDRPFNVSRLPLANVNLAITDTGANGAHGTLHLATFPEGGIFVAGVVASAMVARVGSAIGATAGVKLGLGESTVGVDNSALASNEQNILPVNTATLSSGSGTWATQQTNLLILSGASAAKQIHLNVAIDDADVSASDALIINGFVDIMWAFAGDR